MDPPENMIRCVANNYSTLGFWRSWHRSYNLWIVRYVIILHSTSWKGEALLTLRYIYIPLGGSKNVVPSTLLVFTFVALWHDLSFKLLAWGWLVSLFIIPEILGKALLPAQKVSLEATTSSLVADADVQYGHQWWYRHLSAFGGVLNILLMMSANLVGFVLGIDSMKHLVYELTTTAKGWSFMAFAMACLFVAVQVMFEYREEEHRRGIDRKC
jgi:D-alanyl-lipoteichoic acid acyltransferase DltB (MBOAT superfamily)